MKTCLDSQLIFIGVDRHRFSKCSHNWEISSEPNFQVCYYVVHVTTKYHLMETCKSDRLTIQNNLCGNYTAKYLMIKIITQPLSSRIYDLKPIIFFVARE